MKKRRMLIATSLALGLTATLSTGSSAQEPTLSVPVRLTTWALSMGTIATGRNAVIDINITRWSTAQEREALISAFLEKGQDGLLRALQKQKPTGRFRIPGWQGADPQGFRLGWDLRYAWQVPG